MFDKRYKSVASSLNVACYSVAFLFFESIDLVVHFFELACTHVMLNNLQFIDLCYAVFYGYACGLVAHNDLSTM